MSDPVMTGYDEPPTTGGESARGRRLRLAYLIAVPVVIALLAALASVVSWAFPVQAIATLVLLGPVGVVLALLVQLPAGLIVVSPGGGGVVAAALCAVAATQINVRIVKRLRRRAPRWDSTLGAILFLSAATAFVILCFVAGSIGLTAGGVDVVTPVAQADYTRLIAGIAWGTGLVIAVAGLVAWIVLARRGKRLVVWAAADLVVQVVLIFVALAGSSQ